MEETCVCLQPVYVDQFQCDGSQCNSKCCKHWVIEIDGNTYQRYCGIKSRDERKRITSRIKWKNVRGRKRFVVELKNDGSCPFLGIDGFCSIQKKYGERFLSAICATYPRIVHNLADITERGMTLSCPVAAKLILLQKEPIEFEQVELMKTRPIQSETWDMKAFPLGDFLIDLQYTCISLLQARKLTLDQRLILMGFFLAQVDELGEQGRQDEIRALAEDYAKDYVVEGVQESLGEIIFCTEDYLYCMFSVLETLYGKGKDLSPRADWKYLSAVKDLYHISEETSAVVSMDQLQTVFVSYREFANEIVKEYSYIFENCMVNEFFSNLHPMMIKGSLTENYMYFLMSYKMMEFLTLALAVVRNDEPRKKVLIEGLSFFAGRIDHNVDYSNHILKEIRRYNKNSVRFMRALLDGRT